MTLIKAVSVKPLPAFRLWLEFSDGSRGARDLSALVALDRPILSELRDPEFFKQVFLQRGAPTWPNGFDLAPWAIHDDMAADRTLQPPSHAAE
jgi:hypothetical protein